MCVNVYEALYVIFIQTYERCIDEICTYINEILPIYVVGTSPLFSDEVSFTYVHEIMCVLGLFKI